MALIIKITENEENNSSRIQTEVNALYNEFYVNEKKFVSIRTFGSKDREYKNNASQTIHLDKKIAEELVGLLKKTFKI
jgi:predicted regulator of amino acid metabolism with ACT domain